MAIPILRIIEYNTVIRESARPPPISSGFPKYARTAIIPINTPKRPDSIPPRYH